ncbi:MAG: hypothetical protein KBE91_08735 [Bacteroidia bacterium]|nr:hypothetical protein [Bacteroidia bacterium]
MNIALATIAVFILLTPGFLFRRFYYTEEFSKEYFKQSYLDLFFSSLLPSAVIHILGYYLIISCSGNSIDVKVLGTVLSGTNDATLINRAFDALYDDVFKIVFYLVVLGIISAISGYMVRKLIRILKLDRKFKLLRFQNDWHYVFTGEILDFPKVPGKSEEVDITYIDALVKTDEGTIIYMGLLADYVLSKDGGLDRVYLKNVRRRFLNTLQENIEIETPNKYYELPGEFFVLSYDKIINLHITYYKVSIDAQLEQEIEDIDIES